MTFPSFFLPRRGDDRARPLIARLPQWLLAGSIALGALAVSPALVPAQSTFAPRAIQSKSGGQAVTVKATAAGTVTSVQVLTAGSPNGDFAAGSGGSTCAGAALSAGQSCTERVTFTPSVPGLRTGAVVLLDTGHQVLGVTFISGTGLGGLAVLVPGNMIRYAGYFGLFTGVYDGNPALDAALDLPSGVTMDGAGNMYIADSAHNRVRMVCGAATTATIAHTTCTTAGNISTVAGDDDPAYTGDGGPAADSTLNTPNDVAVDGAGNLFIADTENNVIRMVSAATGRISTIAGGAATVCAGSTDSVGDGCPATQATLYQPSGVTVDAAGNLYIADTFNHRIRMVSAATGNMTTVAGTGYTLGDGGGGYNGDDIPANTAELNFPFGVAFDPQGNMYIPDSGNQRVRRVLAVGGAITAASTIETFAGTGQEGFTSCSPENLPATQANLAWPEGVATDAAGNVYIADTQGGGIRKVNAKTQDLSTLIQAGCQLNYTFGIFSFDQLYGPRGLYVDGLGNVYIADTFDMVVQQVQSNYVAIDDITEHAVRQGLIYGDTLQMVENDGNAPVDLTSITAGRNSAIDHSVADACSISTMATEADCNIGAEFAPANEPVLLAPQIESGIITIDEDTQPSIPAANNPLRIEVVGNAGPGYGTVTLLSSSPNPSGFSQDVALVATVATGNGNLDGSVTFTDTFKGKTTDLADVPLDYNTTGAERTATFHISTLAVGRHSIVATYGGDTDHFGSKSTDNHVDPLIQVVQQASITTLTSSLNPSTLGVPVTFTAVVAANPPNVTPHGSVTFEDGGTALGSVTLTTVKGAQQATLTTSTLTNGLHQVTAVYGGDPTIPMVGSTSSPVAQDVLAQAKLSLASNLNPAYEGNNITFTATVTSKSTQPATGTILFFDNGAQIGSASLAGNPAVAKFDISTLALGTHPITASYAGDILNTAAQTSVLNQVVTLDAFSVTVTPAKLSLKTGANTTVTVVVNSIGGYSDSIIMGCASLPRQVTCEFNPLNSKLPANGRVTANLTIDTNNPLSGGPSAMNRPPGVRGATLAGLVPLWGAVFGWIFWRQRRRFPLGTMVLLLAVSAALLAGTGCGNGISLTRAAPGTYVIQVSGTGGTSYFTRYQDVNLTITQ